MREDRFKKVIEPQIGQRYHLSWAYPSCRWLLVEICEDGKTCKMWAEKKNRYLSAKIEDLRELRRNE